MTYAEFIAATVAAQLDYIARERARYVKAEALWRQYAADMSALGLHPLNCNEIVDRLAQLKRMEAEAPVTHGDTECNRWHFEARNAS